MPLKRIPWISLLISISVLAIAVYILTYDLGTEAKGVTDIRGCNQITTDFVTLEGVYIFGPVRRFQLIAGDAVNWNALMQFAKESPRPSVDPLIELELECTGTSSFPKHVKVLTNTASADAIKHITEQLNTWRFSPYRQGRVLFMFDVSLHRLIIDTTHLVPTDLQDADQIPVEKTWKTQGLDDKYVEHQKLL